MSEGDRTCRCCGWWKMRGVVRDEARTMYGTCWLPGNGAGVTPADHHCDAFKPKFVRIRRPEEGP